MTRPTTTRAVEYGYDGTRMLGQVCAPAARSEVPSILLLHDAYGVSDEMIGHAQRLASLGYPVFIADLWGERLQPRSQPEIGPLMDAMIGDRARWLGRIEAARTALALQSEFDASALVVLGYCFGGSSALEFLRHGGRAIGAVTMHAGLDVLESDWNAAHDAQVLICTGAEDPMASADMLADLQAAMTKARVDWQVQVYGGAKHAFTSPRAASSPRPEAVAYDPRSAERSWQALLGFLHDVSCADSPHPRTDPGLPGAQHQTSDEEA